MSNQKIDYAFKSQVLKEHSDLLQRQKSSSLYTYALYRMYETGEVMHCLKHPKTDMKETSELFLECVSLGLEREFNECVKINHASYERTKRLKQRIENMLLNGNCLFLTLTFNDDALSNTDAKQRRVAVSRYLKQFNCPYVANIDFGKENGREHYHAVINTDKIEFASWRKYGNINAERVRNRDLTSDKTKLAKYICKLSNHAIKETTKRSSLIYSR